ncbi:MAG: type II secretion system protein [Bacilli bacterium]|nr:type II secretion system protein [Bacilli bacterium]
MNKKGFTLAELIGVVIILGLIVLLVVTPILSQIRNQSSKIDNLTKGLLFSTAENYIEQNPTKYIYDANKTYFLTLELLIEKGILEENILNKYNEDTLNKNSIIKVTNNENTFNYELLNPSTYDNIGNVAEGLKVSTFSFMNGTYYKDNPANSYVLFNNILHKILGINADGSIRLMAVENVTKMIPGTTSQSYSNSYVRNWLNDYYYSNLLDNDYITKQEWCIDNQATAAASSTCSTKIKDYVGLITTMELMNHNSLAGNYYNYTYLTMTQSNVGSFYNVDTTATSTSAQNSFNTRPVINVLSSSVILSGTGSIDNPYVLLNDPNTTYTNVKLRNTYHTIGQYITYNGHTYRIMETGAGYVKLVMVPTATDITTSVFSNSSTRFNLSNGIGYLLNTTLRSYFVPTNESLNLTLDTKVYLGEYASLGSNFKTEYLLKTNQLSGVIAAAPKLGEILGATPMKCYTGGSCPTYWLMTDSDANNAFSISMTALVPQSKSETYSVIPTIYISNEGIILSGSGTQSSPFVLGGV